MNSEQPTVKFLKDYKQTLFNIEHIDLHFDIHDDFTDVESVLKIQARHPLSDPAPLILDGVDLELKFIAINSKELHPDEYQKNAETIVIHKVPNEFLLNIKNRIYPHKNTSLEGLYRSKNLFCTQCEAEGFRKITYFIDRPDIMATYKVTIEADISLPVLLSNGNCIKRGPIANNRHYAIWSDPFPKPCYLFALVAGELGCYTDYFKTSDGRTVKLSIYTQHDKVSECHHAMNSLKRAMRWDEDTFGLLCDLDEYNIVAVRDFNMGAMENKGLNIFNSSLLLSDQISTTDRRYRDIESVIAHEYFHNWTGNRVTCRDWFQLCLKEGLTVFRDGIFSQSTGSSHVTRIEQIIDLKTAQFAEDASPMAHPPRPDHFIEINNFYTATVYLKGAEIVRMLYILLGADGFRKGMDLYFQRFDGNAVTQEDFINAMADANEKDLSHFMLWYTQSGTPKVITSTEFNPKERSFSITFHQSVDPTPDQVEKKPLHIPVKCGLLSRLGKPIPLKLSSEQKEEQDEIVLELKNPTHKITFYDINERPVPSLFRQFSAPIKLISDLSNDDLMHLIKYDTDPVNRWDSAQKVWLNTLSELIKKFKKQQPLKVAESILKLFDYLFTNISDDLSFTALLWQLPSYRVLSLEDEEINVEAILAARKAMEQAIAGVHREKLISLYKNTAQKVDESFTTSAMGKRALKNICLTYLASIRDENGLELAIHQFKTSGHMSEVLPAFQILTRWPCDFQETAINSFYERYQNYASAIDDWFAAQATSDLADTLPKVKQLMRHASFDLHNPNRMRSVLFGFCHANPANFHTLDGKGYDLCVENVLALDKINPQMATALARAFLDWRRHIPQRREKMADRLRTLSMAKNLSKDVFEIINRSLA